MVDLLDLSRLSEGRLSDTQFHEVYEKHSTSCLPHQIIGKPVGPFQSREGQDKNYWILPVEICSRSDGYDIVLRFIYNTLEINEKKISITPEKHVDIPLEAFLDSGRLLKDLIKHERESGIEIRHKPYAFDNIMNSSNMFIPLHTGVPQEEITPQFLQTYPTVENIASSYGHSNILVVDDEERYINEIVDLLKKAGFPDDWILRANCAEEAIDNVEKYPIDLIISDWQMPKNGSTMTGLDLLKSIRYKGIPFIFVTGENGETNINKALIGGASMYILKPVIKREELFLDNVVHLLSETYTRH